MDFRTRLLRTLRAVAPVLQEPRLNMPDPTLYRTLVAELLLRLEKSESNK
jgi:hypothetical protein